jgi:hypothetical protein
VEQQRSQTERAVDVRGFEVFASGRASGDSDIAVDTAEMFLYVARVADTVGYKLGAGQLEALEVFGRSSAYAVIDTDAEGALSLVGCVAPAHPSTEELRSWVTARWGR